MSALTVINKSIRQDAEGRYRLNDLHEASGGEKRHQPADWLRIGSTSELIEVISNSGKSRSKPIDAKPGRYGGTFAVKQLVYAYAMWVSPHFHLHVIDSFDAMVMQQMAPAPAPKPPTVLEALQMAVESEQKRLAAEAALARAVPKAEALDRIAATEGTFTLTEAAKMLQMEPKVFYRWMQDIGWMYRMGAAQSFTASQKQLNAGHMEQVASVYSVKGGLPRLSPQARVTPKGLARLSLIQRGRVPLLELAA